MVIDYGKGLALHNLYGHAVFVQEAKKQNRSDVFITHICAAAKCDNRQHDWRDQL